MERIAVFCGSNSGTNPNFKIQAFDFGKKLAEKNIELVFGGGKVGLMGAVADGVLNSGGKVIGVLPQFLKRKELEHLLLTEIIVVETMHERKAKMFDLCDGVVALPGGFGTMDELFEVLTWAQLSLHKKPVAILNTDGYYNFLMDFIDTMIENQFLKKEYRDLLIVSDKIEDLFFQMESFVPQENDKWFVVK